MADRLVFLAWHRLRHLVRGRLPRLRLRAYLLWAFWTVGLCYLFSAYVALPLWWGRTRSAREAAETLPRITHAAHGIPGDPLNLALVGSQEQVVQALVAARWQPADPITLRTSLRLSRATLLRRAYETAPVSNLYLWDRKQDLAFQYPVGNDPRRRHHVRFWRVPEQHQIQVPLWVGAATFDTRVGLSHTTGQVTHHIGDDVDSERDKLIGDLRRAGRVALVHWVESFHRLREGRNGGGDRYHTDGRLPVVVLVAE